MTVATQAARFLFGSDQFAGGGEAVSVNIVDMSAAAREVIRKTPGGDALTDARVVIVRYGDERAANSAREKFFKETMGGPPKGKPGQRSGTDKAYEQLLNYYEMQSTGTLVQFPVTTENEQILRSLHDQAVKNKDRRYERIGYKYTKSELDQAIFGTPGQSGPLSKLNPSGGSK